MLQANVNKKCCRRIELRIKCIDRQKNSDEVHWNAKIYTPSLWQ